MAQTIFQLLQWQIAFYIDNHSIKIESKHNELQVLSYGIVSIQGMDEKLRIKQYKCAQAYTQRKSLYITLCHRNCHERSLGAYNSTKMAISSSETGVAC